ncbi:MAG: 3'-5' exonuclease [Myxococcota bacterium]
MRWTSCRVVAFDTETTGLRPFEGDRIIEFGAVEILVNDQMQVTGTKKHQFMINPEMPIPREASRVSGITDDMVVDAPIFSRLAPQIRDVLTDGILVAHNFGFDLAFLRSEFRRCGMFWPKTRAEVDTLPLSQRKMPELSSHKLAKVAHELSVSLDNAHRASDDAEACGRVFVELARRFGAPPELEGMVDWAVAVGLPPETGHLEVGEEGVARFMFGPHKGATVEQHPDYLQWMLIALQRRDGEWRHQFPDSVRQWAARWLRARTAGRGRGSQRSQGPSDWTIDPPTWS